MKKEKCYKQRRPSGFDRLDYHLTTPVRPRVNAAWNEWKERSAVIYNKRVQRKLK